MNVLMVTSLLPHPGSLHGGGLVMHGQLGAVASSHRVTLLSLAEDTPVERTAARDLIRARVDLHCVWRPSPGSLRRWGDRARLAVQWLRTGKPLRSLAFHRPEIQRLIDTLVRTRSIDLVQVEDSAMGQYRYPADIPRVLTEHEVRFCDADGTSTGAARPALYMERRRWQAFQEQVWSRFDRIQVFTARDAACIERLFPRLAPRISVNPFGITVLPMTETSLERPDELVFVGGFQHAPNVDAACWLVHAILPELRKQVPGVRLTIVGSDPPRRVRALAGAGVDVTGRVPDITPWLERAEVVVAPVRTGGGMRVKVLQAMAMGKAVVTTTRGAEGLAGPDIPLLVADDPAAFAHACAGLLAESRRRRALGRRARAYVAERYTWEAYAARIENLYAGLIAQERDPAAGAFAEHVRAAS